MINTTIVSITLRALIGRRRFLLLFPLPLLMVGLAVLATAQDAPTRDWAPVVMVGLGFSVVLPVLALIIGTGVLGTEIDDGTAVHLLAKPLPRRDIIASKLLVAVLVTAVTAAVPMAATGLLAGDGRLALGLVAGAALGAVAYSAVFLMLSLLTRRPVLIGLVYVVIWESLLANLVSGTAVLSIQQYSVATAVAVSGTPVFDAAVSTPVSLVMAVLVTAAATVLAVDRLRSFSVAGDTA